MKAPADQLRRVLGITDVDYLVSGRNSNSRRSLGKEKKETSETIEVPISNGEEKPGTNGTYLRATWPNQGRDFCYGSVFDEALFPSDGSVEWAARGLSSLPASWLSDRRETARTVPPLPFLASLSQALIVLELRECSSYVTTKASRYRDLAPRTLNNKIDFSWIGIVSTIEVKVD